MPADHESQSLHRRGGSAQPPVQEAGELSRRQLATSRVQEHDLMVPRDPLPYTFTLLFEGRRLRVPVPRRLLLHLDHAGRQILVDPLDVSFDRRPNVPVSCPAYPQQAKPQRLDPFFSFRCSVFLSIPSTAAARDLFPRSAFSTSRM